MPYLRHRSFVLAPASPSFNTPIICSSVNRFDFMVRSHVGGLYSWAVLFAGITSVILAVVKSEDELRKVQQAIIGSGVILIGLQLLAKATGVRSEFREYWITQLGSPRSMGPLLSSAQMLPVAMLARCKRATNYVGAPHAHVLCS